MRKKLFKILLILICFFSFFNLFEVRAAGDYSQISHITNLDINTNSQILTIRGFTFIDHMDNYGGENLHATIIATNSNGVSKSYPVADTDWGNKNLSYYDYYYVRCQQTDTGPQVCNKAHADSILNSRRNSGSCNNEATMTSRI